MPFMVLWGAGIEVAAPPQTEVVYPAAEMTGEPVRTRRHNLPVELSFAKVMVVGHRRYLSGAQDVPPTPPHAATASSILAIALASAWLTHRRVLMGV